MLEHVDVYHVMLVTCTFIKDYDYNQDDYEDIVTSKLSQPTAGFERITRAELEELRGAVRHYNKNQKAKGEYESTQRIIIICRDPEITIKSTIAEYRKALAEEVEKELARTAKAEAAKAKRAVTKKKKDAEKRRKQFEALKAEFKEE